MNLIKTISVAIDRKPKFGEECNHCGYCCLTEVCAVGQELTGSSCAPCKLLVQDGDNHFCKLGESEEFRDVLSMGAGCDAKTQNEVLQELMS